jgi:hypothetical protein
MEIRGIPIPKDKQQEAIKNMGELKTKFGAKLPPPIRKYHKKFKQPAKPEQTFSQKSENSTEKEITDKVLPKIFDVLDVKRSTRTRFGAFYLYQHIAEEIGLLPILMEIFPGDWKKLFTLASYLVTTGEPMSHCERWLEKIEAFPVCLTSSTISKFMTSLDFNDICKFYERWIDIRKEHDYLALDISSVSSYSQLIPDVGYGYNREGDKLPQINMCLLFGEQSQLPFFLKTYHGKLKDVSTLKTTLAKIFSLGGDNLTLVMDKGFASEENINCLIEGPM